MASPQKELEKQLSEAGNKLLAPSSVTELISSLDQVEGLLTRVEQSPSESMRKALSTSMKALIANELLRHSDTDVKVAVASCISEITRITAPDTPYEDDQMKEVFQLIVSSFEKLDDRSSPSYIKRTSILETVAKVRSCVVMLDLECDALIVEMFQHFFRSIRNEHPENVFSSMETIMSLVLEESEDISVDLVSSILNVLKTENKEVLPVARQLGEKVIKKCVIKIKPCLEKAMESLHTTQDDYPKVVANVLKEGIEATKTKDAEAASKNVADENNVANEPKEKAVEVALETMNDATPSEEVGPSTVGSSKSVVSNGTIQKEIEDTSEGNENAKEASNEPHDEEAEPQKTKVEYADAEELTKSRSKPEKVNKRKGKKTNSSKSSLEPSEPPIRDEKECVAMPEVHEKDDKIDGNAQNESPAADIADPAEIEKESEAPVPSPKTSDEPVDVPCSSPNGSPADENVSKKVDSGEKKDELMEDVPDGDLELKESDVKSAEEATDSEPKSHKRTGKKVPTAADKEDSAPSPADISKTDDEKISELDAKSVKHSGKKVQSGSQRQPRKIGKGPAKTPSKDEGKKSVGSVKSAEKPAKDESDEEEESESNSKRRRHSEKKAPKFGKELLGSKIQVWWPDDKKYYTGVIEMFDPSTGKHKVLYNDGDVEVLKLVKETWKLVDGSLSHQGHSSDGESPDETAETLKTKKAKTSPVTPDVGAKQGKTGALSTKTKDRNGTISSRSKVAKEKSLESIGKSEDNKGGKTTGFKSNNSSSKSVGKSKDKEVEPSSKGSNKLKRCVSKSNAKSPENGSKSNGNSKAKATPSSSKSDEEMELSPEPVKTPENSKGKSSSKSQKSSKKKRGVTPIPTKEEDEEIEFPEPVKTPEKSKGKSGSKSQKSSKRKRGAIR